MAAVIETEGLRKEYRRLRGRSTVAVDDLDLSVPAGGVYGFLGPNGSGKTTTIRCLLGLVGPSAGSVRVLGADATTRLHTVLPRIGAIVETPAHFGAFSGRRNLRLLAAHDGIGADRVESVLERVGLADRAQDAVKGYSLGMRQRLGLAAALLKDPELLVLDEPANGLDPAGIREIRILLRSLAEEGRTVFVSSHLLGEVEQTCDRVAILARGRCVAAGHVDDVLAASGQALRVRTTDDSAAARLLEGAGYSVDRRRDHLVARGVADPSEVSRLLGRADVWLTELSPVTASLEDVFMNLTEGGS